MLKRLRDKGHSADEIATELRKATASATTPQDHFFASPRYTTSYKKKTEKPTPPDVHLPVGTLTASAFFVNHDLRIGWIRVAQDDRLSAAIRNEITDDPFGTVFDILLRASLKKLVFNWQPLFIFTYRFLQKTTPPYRFDRLAPTISFNLEKSERLQRSSPGEGMKGLIDSCPINLVDQRGMTRPMRIYGLAISEGTLFVLDEEHWQDTRDDSKVSQSEIPSPAETESGPSKTPFSVLSARLDDSGSIVDMLLPETYYQLMNRIWDESDRIVTSYEGQRAKRSGTDMQYIIPQHTDVDPTFDAICCAFQLTDTLADIEASLKAEGGWFCNIRLNIGISSGSGYLQQEDLTANMAFILPGGAADQADYLSTVTHGGGIWITKSAFSHLTPQQMKKITFGIHRDDKLLRNIFTQVSDLPHAPGTACLVKGIRSLSVTRIIDLEPE
jgi:class 3 adenylate cyclase